MGRTLCRYNPILLPPQMHHFCTYNPPQRSLNFISSCWSSRTFTGGGGENDGVGGADCLRAGLGSASELRTSNLCCRGAFVGPRIEFESAGKDSELRECLMKHDAWVRDERMDG